MDARIPDRIVNRIAVLYIAPWVIPGGSDKGTVDWFRTIDRGSFETHLITTNVAENFLVPRIERLAKAVWNLPDFLEPEQFGPFILDYVRRHRIAVVHVMNSQLGFDLIPYLKAVRPAVAVVVQQHAEEDDESLYVRYVALRYGHLLDAYSATSEDLKRRIVGYGVDPARVEVIYTGIDAETEWVPGQRPQRPSASAEFPLRVLYPGRLEEQKDPHLMLDIAQELKRLDAPVVIDVVGDGSLRADLEARAEADGLCGNVVFQGLSLDMASWYRKADVVLMTSRYEGIPYVLFEAMAMGVPVVAPDVNANAELVDEAVGSLIVDRADIAAYVGTLQAWVTRPDLVRALGRTARQRVLDRFSLRSMAVAHEALYRRLAAAMSSGEARVHPS
ncbi:MAG: glycosyltransferase family 4 protein [Acidimicrobiales bacterium]